MSFLYHWELFGPFITMAVVSALLVGVIGGIVLKLVYKDEDEDKENR